MTLKSRNRNNPAASQWITPRLKCTPRSTRSPNPRKTRTSSGWGRMTATSRSPATAGKRGRTSSATSRDCPRMPGSHRSTPATSATAPRMRRSTFTCSATCGRMPTRPRTSAGPGPRSSARGIPCAATPTSSKRISSIRTSCSSGPNLDCGFLSTAASNGRNTRAETSRMSPSMTWSSIRATTTSSSPRTAGGSGSSTTSRRSAR